MRKTIAALFCTLTLTAQAQQLPPGSVLGNFDPVQAPPYPVPTTGTGAVVRATDPVMGNINVGDITSSGSIGVSGGIGVGGSITVTTGIRDMSQATGCAQYDATGVLRTTGSSCPDIGAGNSYIDNGMDVTLPTSGLRNPNPVAIITNGGATCSNPTAALNGGTQSPPSAAGGGSITLTTTGTAPNQTITGATVVAAGSYSWPPMIVVSGCTGTYKLDAVLTSATMLTVTTAAGTLVSGGVRYAVPAYTHTYPIATGGCDYFNTSTLAWVTNTTCNLTAPNVFVQLVLAGPNIPSWPNGSGSTAAPQIYEVLQIPGVVPLASRLYSTTQQGALQTSLQGRDYACTLGATAGNGGCDWKGRFFSFSSDDPTSGPYTNRLDINPQLALTRRVPGRAPRAGDLGGVITFSAQSTSSGNGVGMNQAMIFATTVDPTDASVAGKLSFATANSAFAGGVLEVWSLSRGMMSGQALDKGDDTINVNNLTNSVGNPAGLYISTGATVGAFYGAAMNISGHGTIGSAIACHANPILCVRHSTNNNFWIIGPGTRTTGINIFSINDAGNSFNPMELQASEFLFTTGKVTMSALTAAAGTPNAICQNNATKEITVNVAANCTVSSLRFKQGFEAFDKPALPLLMAMQPSMFEYKEDPGRQRIGFGSEQLTSVDRRLGDAWDDEGPRSIDQSAILAVVVKAVQELNRRVEGIK